MPSQGCESPQSPRTPTEPPYPPTSPPNRFHRRRLRVASLDSTSHATSDATLDTSGDKRQVAVAHHSSRRAFETMYVSIIVDGGTPFDKKLLLVNSTGDRKTLPLLGTSAWLTRAASSHPEDAQPSFAENSVCIRLPDSMITWIVASPTAEDQRSFLDRLCLAGCTLRDLADHFELLPEADQPTGGILRLGRQTTTRMRANAEIVALKVAHGEQEMSQLLNEAKVLQNLHHDGIMRAYGIYEVRFQGKKSLGMVLWALKEE